ncbi:MAG: aspartate/tyrosine/aromatic aminotransferase, partial [Kordiimonadaceae bacterium]|nr:aspartate/tyrosine/aromatic aminotransferase [Kordiimonadaceae bacterium]
CVKKAEEYLVKNQETKAYLSPAGNPGFNDAIKELLFGTDHPVLKENRVVTFQAPGGTGAIRIGIDFLKTCKPDATVWVSDPTWPNHYGIVDAANLTAKTYRYYNMKKGLFLFDEMMEDLGQANEGDVILLHGCCHNASGADLSNEQWNLVADFMLERKLVPFIDIAYQGFANGIEKDAYVVKLLCDKLPEAIVASSCSKNFAIYRDRVGAVSIVSATEDLSKINGSHVLKVVRSIYSMPPDHGAAVVSHILNNVELRNLWIKEVDEMRTRVKEMRHKFVTQMAEKAPSSDFGYIAEQNGMFSYLTLTPEQTQILIKEHHIYMMANGRVNIAGLTLSNMDYVTDAIASLFN